MNGFAITIITKNNDINKISDKNLKISNKYETETVK